MGVKAHEKSVVHKLGNATPKVAPKSVRNMLFATESVEVRRMDDALHHCDEVKDHIGQLLKHVHRLEERYNQTDYSAILRDIENNMRATRSRSDRSKSRTRSIEPYQKQRPRHQSTDQLTAAVLATPTKQMVRTPSKQMVGTPLMRSTPLAKKPRRALCRSASSSSQSLAGDDTPFRSMRMMREENNRVRVDAIKLQRELDSMAMKLRCMERERLRVQRVMAENSLYQNSTDSLLLQLEISYLLQSPKLEQSTCSTPNGAKRTRLDDSNHTLRRIDVLYGTPLQKMHKRLRNVNALAIRSC